MTDREEHVSSAREIVNIGQVIMGRATSVSVMIQLGKDPADALRDLELLAADVRGRVRILRKQMADGGDV